MLIYIMHKDRIFTFRLPKTVSGNYVLFDCDDKGVKRSLVNIYAYNDSQWFMKSNEDIQIYYNGKYAGNIELKEYNFYQLNVYKTENLLLYVMPAYETNYISKTLTADKCKLEVGRQGCDIIYGFSGIEDKQVELSYQDGYWYYRNLDARVPVYVNKANKMEAKLSNLDTIFIMGLKILICNKTLFIKAPGNNVYFFNDKLADEFATLAVRDREINNEVYKDFYETDQYFNKSPIFRKKINTLKLTITSPNDKELGEQGSLLMQVVPTALMSLTSLLQAYYSIKNYQNGTIDKESIVTTLVMCVGMLFISIVWPFVERLASRIRSFINERKRVHVYTKYLKKKKSVLETAKNEQKMALEFNNISLEECATGIQNRFSSLFSSGINHDNFLNIRLGKGRVLLDCVIDYQKPDFVQSKDKLLNDIDRLLEKYKYIDDVPFSFSLSKEKSLAFINSSRNFTAYMNAILLQLITFHDYATLKLVILTSDTSSNLMGLRNLSHCWDDEKSTRFFATNLNEAENISTYLVRIFNQRIVDNREGDSASKKNKIPFYLIICDHLEMYRNIKIIESILDSDVNLGFGIMMFGQKLTDIPDGCANFLEFDEKKANIFKSEMTENNIHTFIPEFLDNKIDFNYCVRLVGNIPIQVDIEKQGNLPTRLGFLEMYGVGNIEQLNISSRWKNSNVTTTLAAPVGVDASGNIISLDLHEKKHGPHGLIAGMTGSGKSEFIITYILSLAVNYSPDEVQFVLIDYKGGGLAGAFENRKTRIKLPHLVGTITNLDKSEMNRTLVSIKSELQRRQRVFNEAKEMLDTGNMDIYKYQKLHREGTLKEPLSHLFIICDEFAELKSQQPDFMDELVSAARIGRSLGVHLILATQKPSGVVDEQIWSNSKFKVCCKVQTADDSNEMIQRPDAAYLKDSGRFYLQIGYDEFFIQGQSGYSGIAYTPTETVISKTDNSISFVSNIGEVYQSAGNKQEQTQKKKENLGEELINILKYIIDVANKENFKYQQLWLDSLPKVMYLDDLRKKYSVERKPFNIRALIGEYDDPRNQKQGPAVINITNSGNLFISGVAGSGKTTLLSTIIYSIITTHSVEEVNFYIVDLGAETLRSFSLAPQVGEVLTVGDKDRILKMFYYLKKEMEKRKKYYSVNGGSFENDVRLGKSAFANIIIVINGYDVFREQFEDFNDSFLPSFTRECSRYGITIILTCVGTSIGYVLQSNFPNKVVLKLADSSDYSYLVGSESGMIPNDNPGRGMIPTGDGVYEFQTSLIFDYDNLSNNLSFVIGELCKMMKNKAPKVPEIPNHVTISSFKNESISLSSIPIGYEVMSACPYFYDFDKLINIVTYGKDASIKSFVPALITLLSYLNNVKNICLSAYDDLIIDNDNVKFYDANFKSVLMALYKNIEKVVNDAENKNKYVITIFGYSKLQNHMKKLRGEKVDNDIDDAEDTKSDETVETASSDETIIDLDDIILLAKDSDKIRFILVDNMGILKSVDNTEWYSLFDPRNGILVSGNIDDQELFITESSYSNETIMRDDAIVIHNGSKEHIKFVNIK